MGIFKSKKSKEKVANSMQEVVLALLSDLEKSMNMRIDLNKKVGKKAVLNRTDLRHTFSEFREGVNKLFEEKE